MWNMKYAGDACLGTLFADWGQPGFWGEYFLDKVKSRLRYDFFRVLNTLEEKGR
jgi:hypothetical protein